MPKSSSHWEAYYRTGALATCPTGPGGTYDREVRDAWLNFFGALPDGARVLDVGTGNGAIALLAREAAAAHGRSFEIHGTDLAAIDPLRDVPRARRLLEGIHFHAGVATESLPFQSASFDAVSGHHAIEYMDIDAALREVHRVLKPAGRAQFIVHHSESVIVQNARESLQQSELVLDDTRVYELLRAFLAAKRRASSQDTAQCRQELEQATDAIRAAHAATRNPLILNVTLDAVGKLLSLQRTMAPHRLDREIDRVDHELRASVARLRDLVQHAHTPAMLRELQDTITAIGFVMRASEPQFHAGSNLVGWRLVFARAGGSQDTDGRPSR